VALTWHDNACEHSFSLISFNFYHVQHVKMSDASLVEKLRRISQEKEEAHRILVHEQETKMQQHETLATKG
jgi:hypothetical protein